MAHVLDATKIATMETVVSGTDHYDTVIDIDVLPNLDWAKSGWTLQLSPHLTNKIHNLLDTDPDWQKIPDNIPGRLTKPALDLKQIKLLSDSLFPEDSKRVRVCVVGLFDRGKTFLLNRLAKLDLGSGKRVSTRGISIKIPTVGTGQPFVLLDSAGTNIPLDKETVAMHVRSIRKMDSYSHSTHGKNKRDSDRDTVICEDDSIGNSDSGMDESRIVHDDIEEDRQRDKDKQELEEKEKKISKQARESAIISKQVTDWFLQDLIIELSDVVIIVVNEMTFEDQLYSEILVRKLEKLRERNLNRRAELYVVHNFKDTRTKAQLDYLVKKYVVGCFDGKMMTAHVNVVGMTGSQEINYYKNSDNRMVHVWLAQEDEPTDPDRRSIAGEKNSIVFEWLLERIQVATKAHTSETSLLRDITSHSLGILKELNFFRSIEVIDLFRKGKAFAIHGRGAFKREVDAQGRKLIRIKPLRLAPEEVVSQGKTMTFRQHSDFNPPMDILYGDDGMLVIVDLGGVWVSTDPAKLAIIETKDNENSGKEESVTHHSTFEAPFINPRTDELIISGERVLYSYEIKAGLILPNRTEDKFYGVDQERPKSTVPLQVTFYNREDTKTMDVVKSERRPGKFEKKVKIPYKYSRKTFDLSWGLLNGVLQVSIPATVPDDPKAEESDVM